MCNFGSLHKTPPHVMYITGKLKPKDITQNTTARLRKRLVLYPPPPFSSPSRPLKERTRKTKPPIDAIMVITRPVQVMAPWRKTKRVLVPRIFSAGTTARPAATAAMPTTIKAADTQLGGPRAVSYTHLRAHE